MSVSNGSPYKFLDSYGVEDRDRFFGRSPEINILVADVVTTRLVVLFAKTGTGKTSLINAGARPVLHDRGYATFFVRVEKDPVASARKALATTFPGIRRSGPFGRQLAGLAARLGRPIVLFFDQFEEFFLYVAQDEPSQALAFVDAIGDVYDDEGSGVHIVFSMREEFFVELELFRDRIPSIFHADSNLRLKHLDPAQARLAIVEPARANGVEIETGVADEMIADLAQKDPGGAILVEPAQLQIVCDALWPRAVNGRIGSDEYESLGPSGTAGGVAQTVLYDHVRRELDAIDDRGELELAERLLPLLRTERRTKWIRDVPSLQQLLATDGEEIDEDRLRVLLRRLAAAGLVNLVLRDRMEAVELKHDYLVERIDAMLGQIRAIWPQRVLRQCLDQYTQTQQLATRSELADMLDELPYLDLGRPPDVAVELLFLSAVANGQQALQLFDFGIAHGLEPLGLVERLRGSGRRLEQERTATFLGDLAVERPQVRSQVFSVLRTMLHEPAQTFEAQRALGSLAAARAENIVVSEVASELLLDFLRDGLDSGQVSSSAVNVLGEVATAESVDLLERALERPDLSPYAQDAIVKLAASAEVGESAATVLVRFVRSHLADETVDPRLVRRLGSIASPEALDALREALSYEQVREEAEIALREIAGSSSDLAPSARGALAAAVTHGEAGEPPARRRRSTPAVPAPGFTPDWRSSEFELISELVQQQRCVLLLGAGIHASPPAGSPFTYPDEARPPVGAELSRRLADDVDLASRSPTDDPTNLARVAMYYEVVRSRHELVARLSEDLTVGKQPSPILRALAQLDFPIVITTNYDQLLERALFEAGKQPRVAVYTPRLEPTKDYRDLSASSPVIFKLHGDIAQPESLVVTDEDHMHFTLRMNSKEPYDPIPLTLKYYLSAWATLAIGYSLLDYNLRLLFKTLRWKIDTASAPDMYVVDYHPDPLLFDVWNNQRRYAKFIAQDIWTLVPGLYRRLTAQEMMPA